MTLKKPQNSKSPAKTKRRRGLISKSKIPSRGEIREVNLNGKTVKAKVLLRAKLVSDLSFSEKEKICKAANVGFLTVSDWAQIDVALDELAWESKASEEGVSYPQVESKIQECMGLAERLRNVMCNDEGGEIAAARISWFLNLGVAGPNSAIEAVSQIILAIQSADKYLKREKEQSKTLSPFVQFVERIAQVFDAYGVGISTPKPTDYEFPQPSQFQKFICALLVAKPTAAPSIDCSENGIAALMSRIAEARREFRKRPRSSPA